MARKQPKRKPRSGVDSYGRTPLHYAAIECRLDDLKKLLFEGVDPNAQDDDGWSSLHFASQCYSTPITEALLSAGASTELRDSFGNTPLSTAVFNSRGDGSVIKLLRDAGADPNAVNEHGVSPLRLARSIGNFDVAQFFADLP